MQKKLKEKLEKVLSEEKMNAYHNRKGGSTDKEIYAHYLWNIQLSEALYPLLQTIEVALRNNICNSIFKKYNLHLCDFSNDYLLASEKYKIDNIKNYIIKEKGKYTQGQIIESLNFGFWTALFDRRYEHSHILWPHLLKGTFPAALHYLRNRKEISKRLNKIRRLRNRIFHHGSIWHWRDLEDQHKLMIEILKWLSPGLQTLIVKTDRFQDVYNNGYATCLKNIEDLNNN